MRKSATGVIAALAVILAGGGVSPADAQGTATQMAQTPAPPRPTVAPEKTSYQPFEPIVVRWKDMMAPTLYIMLKRSDAERPTATAITTGGAVGPSYRTGSYQFPGQLPGEYDIEVRAGNDDKGYLLARSRATVVDPNQEQQAAPPVAPTGLPQSASPGTAPAPGALALPPPTLPTPGGRFGLKFTDAPTPVDVGQFASLLNVVQQGTGRRCVAPGEGFGWNVSVREETRIRRLYAEAADGMMTRRYAMAQLPLQYPNAYAYRAENAAANPPDRALLLAWYFASATGTENGTLYLVVCPSE